jgi:Spy/CpxP family protein refolding chaperone
MSRKGVLLLVAGVAAGAVFATAVSLAAQGLGPGRQPGWWGPLGPRWGFAGLGRLDLTAEQRDGIRRILSDRRESLRAAAQETRRLELELRKAILSQDAAAVATLTDQLAAAYRTALEARLAVQQQIAALLTPEQRSQLISATQSALERPGRWRRR